MAWDWESFEVRDLWLHVKILRQTISVVLKCGDKQKIYGPAIHFIFHTYFTQTNGNQYTMLHGYTVFSERSTASRSPRWRRESTSWLNLGEAALYYFWGARGLKSKWDLSRYLIKNLAMRFGFRPHFDEVISLTLDDIQVSFRPLQGELYLYKEIFVDKVYERHPAFRPCPGWCVFDVGANIGMFSLKAARNNTTGKLYAFEPIPRTYGQLVRNLDLNGVKNVVPLQKAVAGCSGEARFDRASTSTTGRFVDASVQGTSAPLTVEVVSLAAVIQEEQLSVVNLLKLDVEGAEVDVLRGAQEMFSRIERIVMEYHSPDLLQECERILKHHCFKKVLQVRPSYVYFMRADCEL